jgi:hypothetical protein
MTHPKTRRATPPDRRTSKIDRRRWGGLQIGLGIFRPVDILVMMAVLAGFRTSAILAVEGSTNALQTSSGSVWDSSRYIDINEIQPGMEGYCLTCYVGTQPERFGLKVVSVIRNFEPGYDALLVMGTDERFQRTNTVSGCSGSPVYLDGRMAGALAFGWSLSKEPLYGVTPIRQMLKIGSEGPPQGKTSTKAEGHSQGMAVRWDYSDPIDLSQIESRFLSERPAPPTHAGTETHLPCTLTVSGLPREVCEQMASGLGLGLEAVPTIGGREDPSQASDKVSLVPGASMLIPLVDGDIRMAVLGTVTEVEGDKVYGFGHNFLGYGPVNLPLATARVHTVVSNLSQSFKIGSALDVVGALTFDEPRGVVGRIGQRAKTVPLQVEVTRFNSAQGRRFDCRLAYHKTLTPDLLRAVLSGATQSLGALPPDHTVTYTGQIELENGHRIRFSNISSGMALSELISESAGTVILLLNNPFQEVPIRGARFTIDVTAEDRLSSLYSVDVSDQKVKPGQEIVVGAVVESYPAVKRRFEFKIRMPERIEPGEYTLTVCGSYEYQQMLKRLTPYRFLTKDTGTLIEALEYLLSLKRDRLYCLLELPASGVTVERQELPDLPASKALVLESVNRTIAIQPFQPWIEKSVQIDTITAEKESFKIKVEKP